MCWTSTSCFPLYCISPSGWHLVSWFVTDYRKKYCSFEMDKATNVSEHVRKQQLHHRQVQGNSIPSAEHSDWLGEHWQNTIAMRASPRKVRGKKNSVIGEKEKKRCESCWCSHTSASLLWQQLTSLMAVQNSLWRTFFRDCSLWPGTSPDSCSFSSSSMALATSGREKNRCENACLCMCGCG